MMKLLLFTIYFVYNTTISQTMWEKLNGPSGATIASLYANGDTIIAGTGYKHGLIFYSTDNGVNWKDGNIKVKWRFTSAVSSEDGGIIVGVMDNNLYKSYDMYKWEKIFSIHENDQFFSLGKDHKGFIYAGTNFGRIYLSTDNGKTWNFSLNITSGERVTSFLLSYDSILYAGALKKFYKKIPNASFWETIPTPFNENFNNPFTDNENLLYVYSDQFIIRSSNQGATWIQLDTARFLFNNIVYQSIYNNRIISALADVQFIGFSGYGIAVSDDKGYTWRYSNEGLPSRFSGAVRLAKSGGNTYLGTNAAGVFKSTDFGDSWFSVNNGIVAASTQDICFDNEGTIYSANWSNGFQKSTDNGQSWTVINNGLNDVYCMSIIADDNGILMGGTENTMYRSTNKGLSWEYAGQAGNRFVFHFEKDKQNRFYALTYGTGLYRSTNSGISWVKLDNGFISGFVFGFAIDSIGNIYAGTRAGAIYKSTNDGQSWTRVYLSSNPNSVISRISIAPNGYIYAANINEGILRSTNNGISWQILTNGFTSLKLSEIAANSKGELYASTYSIAQEPLEDKLYKSTDMGESWTDITGKLYLTEINEIHITDTDEMYFATDESIWHSIPDSTTGVKDQNILNDYKLSQNYPNPFNPTTTIEFSLPKEENVKLSLYSILGEELRVLVNEKMTAGVHKYTLDASALPSGVYMYRLRAGGFSDTKKLVVIK